MKKSVVTKIKLYKISDDDNKLEDTKPHQAKDLKSIIMQILLIYVERNQSHQIMFKTRAMPLIYKYQLLSDGKYIEDISSCIKSRSLEDVKVKDNNVNT